MKHLIILVGNIGSGKTTLCNTLVKNGFYIISRDRLRYMIGNGEYIFNPTLESAIHKSAKKITEEFMRLGVDLVIDEVNVSKNERKQYLTLANKYKYKKTALVMPKLTKKQSVDRRLQSPHGSFGRKIWNLVWTKFNNCYIEPTTKEGFNSIIYHE